MSCKAIAPKTAVIVFVAMAAIKLVKFLIAKSLKLNHRYLISIICVLLFACRIFSATIIVIEEDFWRIKNRIVNKAILIGRHPVWTYVSANQLLYNNFSLMVQRQCSDGIMVSFCVIAALPLQQATDENDARKYIETFCYTISAWRLSSFC